MCKSKFVLSALCSSLFLTGCGGSSVDQQVTPATSQASAEESTTTVGVITGFGSVFVNGIEYETDTTQFEIDDDLDRTEDDLEVGMVVSLSGSVNTDGSTGNALKIHYSESIKGLMQSIDLVASTLTVMGQTVYYDDLTTFDNLVLEELVPGDFLEISGFIDANGELYATRIEKEDAVTDLKLKGIISDLDNIEQTFRLNELTINYGSAEINNRSGDLVDGQKVMIKGTVDNLVNDVFTIAKLKVIEDRDRGNDQKEEGDRQELEGFIDSWISTNAFTVNGIQVVTTSETEIKHGSLDALVLNARIKLKGYYDADGNLVAHKIHIHQRSQLKISGEIQAINTEESTLTVMGVTFNLSDQTKIDDDSESDVRYFSIKDLSIGDFVEIKGFIDNEGNHIATKLERKDEEPGLESDEIELKGKVSDISDAGFTIMGVQVRTSDNTRFEASNGEEVTQEKFFEDVQSGMLVEVEGVFENGVFLASEVEVKGEDESEEGEGKYRTEFKGKVESISELGLVVSNRTVTVTESTEFEMGGQKLEASAFFELIEVGDILKVEGEITEDKDIIAREIESFPKNRP